jgi:hypothetical protein
VTTPIGITTVAAKTAGYRTANAFRDMMRKSPYATGFPQSEVSSRVSAADAVRTFSCTTSGHTDSSGLRYGGRTDYRAENLR